MPDFADQLMDLAMQIHRNGFRGTIVLDLGGPGPDAFRVRVEHRAQGLRKVKHLLRTEVPAVVAPEPREA